MPLCLPAKGAAPLRALGLDLRAVGGSCSRLRRSLSEPPCRLAPAPCLRQGRVRAVPSRRAPLARLLGRSAHSLGAHAALRGRALGRIAPRALGADGLRT